MHPLPEEELGAGCIMGRRQCDALANVLLGNLGSCIHVDVTVTLKTVADLILPFTAG